MTKYLDFLDQLKDEINSLELHAHCVIGGLGPRESISLMAMPGGEETVFFDGSRDKAYQVQINAKSMDQNHCINSLTKIYQTLENLVELPSQNDSYEFGGITTRSLPSYLHQDEQGFYIYVLSISANITIYQGVKL